MKKHLLFPLFLFSFATTSVFSQALQLLKDINPGSGGSSPYSMMQLFASQYLFFAIQNNASALWLTDGTPAGTILVKLFASGSAGSYSSLTKLNDAQAIFTAGYGTADEEVWVTDGTALGTYLLHSFNAGIYNNPAPEIGPIINGKAFLKVMVGTSDQNDRWQLWTTDGTISNTTLLADSIDAHHEQKADFKTSTVANNVLIFYGFNPKTLNYQVWRSDATKTGTYLLKNFGTTPFEFSNMITLNDQALLAGFDNAHGDELWHSDGTVSGTKLLKDIIPGSQGSNPVYFTLLNQKIYFKTDGDTRLWLTNGKANGTKLVPGIDPEATISAIIGVSGTRLYFVAWDAQNSIQLYRTKGKASSSVQLTDASNKIFSISNEFADVNGTTYFSMLTLRNNNISFSLYQSNGTTSGTIDVYDTPADDNITDLTTAGSSIFFIESNGSGLNRTLYSHSTSDGVQQHDFFSNRDDNAEILLVSGSSIFLSLNGTGVGQEPYVYTLPAAPEKITSTDNGILLYPNPTAGNLIVQGLSNFSRDKPATILIMDLSGRMIYSREVNITGTNTTSLQIPFNIPNGMYLMRIETKDKSFRQLIDLEK